MSLPENHSLLENADNCILLHQGGEAGIYLVCLDGHERLVLKWYNQPFNTALVGAVEKVRDAGICKIREFGEYQGNPFQLYDYVDGVPSDSISEMPTAIALKAMRQLVATLTKASKVGASHGDLNPANVIFSVVMDRGKKDFQTVLIDWGITGPGALAYAAPERFQGKQPDEKSDIFSLGMLLFRWLTGENLVQVSNFDQFALENGKLSSKGVSEKLFLKGTFSPQEISALESLWENTLQNDPEDRAEDFDELDELLEIALEKIGGGEISLSGLSHKFSVDLSSTVQKMGEKVSNDLGNPERTQFPFKISNSEKRRFNLKYAILCGIGIVALFLCLWQALGTETPDVDDTGELILKNSRSLDLDLMDATAPETEIQEEVPVQKILNDLPTPSKE